jgi:magnesium transporter
MPAVFHGVSFNPHNLETRRFGHDDLERELADDSVFSWIDIESPDIFHLNDILQRMKIDLTLVSRFDAPEILPRIVERPDCLAFYLYEIADPEQHLDTSRGLREIDFGRMILVLGHQFVLTYHHKRLNAVDFVKGSCEESFRLAGKSPGFIVFLFLQRCLYDYAHLNLANDNYLDVLEEGVLAGKYREMTTRISIAGTNILTLKKLAASLHIVLMLIVTKRSPFITPEARASFGEMLQNTVTIRGSIDSSRDLLDGVIGNLQTAATNRTNDIVRVLTIVSAIILPLTLITGIYGMNFTNMPETESPFGYFIVLGIMSSLALVLLVTFFRLGWIFPSRRKQKER